MEILKLKQGRLRLYDLPLPPGFRSRELAALVATMQEMAERVYDQVEDLPREALDYTSGETRLSIGRLLVHLAWAEATWVPRLVGRSIAPELEQQVRGGSLELFSQPPAAAGEAAALIALCRSVQHEHSEPVLRPLTDLDTPIEWSGRKISVRGIMGQLTWHWVYHSGQIGLLRFECGSDYQWRSGDMVANRPS
jgi:uncharacterized damage-inducible protein DinB